MADPKAKPEEAEAKAAPKAQPKAKDLIPAGESSNPEVHNLLAELQTVRLNGDTAAADRVLDRLAELGYSAE